MITDLPPLSLYVHLPWCVRKCPYCDFNSHTAGESPPRSRYVNAIIGDLASETIHAGDRPIETVFLGGGTPSLFSPKEIGKILDAAASRLDFAADCEITMEANPGTIERGDFAGFRQAGVNRISLGAQSFNSEMLTALMTPEEKNSVSHRGRAFRELRNLLLQRQPPNP